MSYREKDVVYETGRFWVLKERFKDRYLFKVFEADLGTHVSTHRGTYDTADGFKRAKNRADELAAKH